ncbi:olfactory receptor CU1 [Amia ocellicauda]|uniref:olfactory receptor CU1 n=1 Tax=Amia ocellicauda TaxID=2972642 RepID=UPI0034647A99
MMFRYISSLQLAIVIADMPVTQSVAKFDYRAFRWVQTMVFAIEEINSNTSLLPGVTLGYKIADSCDNIHNGLRGALSLVNGRDDEAFSPQCHRSSPLPAIIGLASSSPTRAVAHTVGPFSIPLISYFATCACLNNKQEFPSFLRTVPSDLFQVRGLVQLVNHFGWTWVGAIATDDDYGLYGIQAFAQQLEESGGCLSFYETIPKTYSAKKVKLIVEIIKFSTAKVIIVFMTEGRFLEILQEVVQQNITSRQWVASEAWVTATLLSTQEFHTTLGGTIGFAFRSAQIPGLREFLLRIRPSPYLPPNSHVCTGSEDLMETNNIYSDVSQLRVSYNVYKAVYAIAHALHKLLDCEREFGERVNFDQNGEPVPLYDIINWQKDDSGYIRFKKVGSFDGSAPEGKQLQIKEGSIVPKSVCSESCPFGTRIASRVGEPLCCFDCRPCADGEISNKTGSTECIKCPPDYWSDKQRIRCVARVVEFLSFQDTLGIILVILSFLGVSVTLAVFVTFYNFRSTPLVRANNSELSFLLLAALVLCFLCALTFLGEPSEWTCMARQAAFAISFVLCISCILVKTIVVLVAFSATLPGSNAIKLFGPLQQRGIIIICTAIQVLLCTVWLAVAPPFPFKNTMYQGGKIILECKVGSALAFYSVLGYIGFLSCICFALAFLGRKLPGSFNEAKFITFSMLIFFAVWISFIPAYQSSPGKYTVAVEIFAIFSSSFGLLVCIFVPKCYIILLRPEKNTKKCVMSQTLIALKYK